MSVEFKNKTVVCRKSHKCWWCDEVIKKGDTAQFRAGVSDGDFYSIHVHPECDASMCASDFTYAKWYEETVQLRGKTYDESHKDE